MKALFVGGTGTISSAVAALAVKQGWNLTMLNRGNQSEFVPQGVRVITGDIKNHPEECAQLLAGETFDVVAEFIGYVPSEVERDINMFRGKTGQYIYISSASAYQKPASNYLITEGTPLSNPYWQYSRDKIACEEKLMHEYRETGFPVTIVRPSHTYGETKLPVPLSGKVKGGWQVVDRIRRGKPVIVHGDGYSLWTLTHNSDFAKGFVGLMGNPHAIGEAVHITSDETVTWNCAFESLGRAIGVMPKMVHMSCDFIATHDPDQAGPLLGDRAHSVVFDLSLIHIFL